jgi:hypothetical protein
MRKIKQVIALRDVSEDLLEKAGSSTTSEWCQVYFS